MRKWKEQLLKHAIVIQTNSWRNTISENMRGIWDGKREFLAEPTFAVY